MVAACRSAESDTVFTAIALNAGSTGNLLFPTDIDYARRQQTRETPTGEVEEEEEEVVEKGKRRRRRRRRRWWRRRRSRRRGRRRWRRRRWRWWWWWSCSGGRRGRAPSSLPLFGSKPGLSSLRRRSLVLSTAAPHTSKPECG